MVGLERAIGDFIQHHNRDPKPFQWSAADEILASMLVSPSAQLPIMSMLNFRIPDKGHQFPVVPSVDRWRSNSYLIAMRLLGDPETAAWLESLRGGSGDFDWDDGNRSKGRKHGVTVAATESMLRHSALFAGRIVEPEHPEARWLLLGVDDGGRRLALVFTRRGSRMRPISCRPMRRKESQAYEEAIREGEKE